MTRPKKSTTSAPAVDDVLSGGPRWIDYMPLDTVLPALRNAKNHDAPGIRDSIGRFGIVEIMVLDDRTGRLVSGHGRREDLLYRRTAAETPPDGIQATPEGDWLVPVVRGWASRSDDEAEAVILAMNRLVETGGHNSEVLAEMLAHLAGLPEGLIGTGYSTDAARDLLAALGPAPDLDKLAASLGEPKADDFWPILRFRVPPELRDRFLALMEGEDDDPAVHFGLLVDAYEQSVGGEP